MQGFHLFTFDKFAVWKDLAVEALGPRVESRKKRFGEPFLEKQWLSTVSRVEST